MIGQRPAPISEGGHRTRELDRKVTPAVVLVTLAVFAAACVSSPEPRIEASPSAGVTVVASSTGATTEPAPDTDTRPDIYMVDPETGSVAPLLSSPESHTNAEVSPDGERVVFGGFPADGTNRLWLRPLNSLAA